MSTVHSVSTTSRHPGWLDSLAATLSMLCAIHCLVMPGLLVSLPIVATSFFADANFHLWMLLLVVPFAAIALFLGCRKHRDRLVFGLGIVGLVLLTTVAIHESLGAANAGAGEEAHCPHCAPAASTTEISWLEPVLLLNLLGGLCLVSAHVRNYLLCKKGDCDQAGGCNAVSMSAGQSVS